MKKLVWLFLIAWGLWVAYVYWDADCSTAPKLTSYAVMREGEIRWVAPEEVLPGEGIYGQGYDKLCPGQSVSFGFVAPAVEEAPSGGGSKL